MLQLDYRYSIGFIKLLIAKMLLQALIFHILNPLYIKD